jgi:hypothetical protein
VLVTGVAFVALAVGPAASSAADYTWSGAGAAPLQTGSWSDPANWSAGTAPTNGETIGALTFPALSDPACDSTSPSVACGRGTNDLTGLSVGTLAINDAHVASRGAAYTLRGNEIALTGGLAASPGAVMSNGRFENTLALPITLTAPQTWSLTGKPLAPSQLVGPVRLADGISLLAPVNGSAQPLTIRFSGGVGLSMSGDNEVGPVSVIGDAVGQPPFEHRLAIRRAELNAGDGNPVSITNAELDASGAFGPLTLKNSLLAVGEMRAPAGTVTAPTVQLDSRSALHFTISGSGSVAGVDYSQLRSTGPIALGGAHLSVATGSANSGSRCPTPRIGTVYTLVSTSATLTGALDVPQDGLYRFFVSPRSPPLCAIRFALRIKYHESGSPQTVTGTVVPTPPGGIAPGVAGASSVRGRVLLRRRGQTTFTRIGAGALIPAGSELDTTLGRLHLTVATNRQGGTADATLSEGRFVFRQTGKTRLRTRFTLSQPLDGCGRARGRAATASRRRHGHRRRHIWVTEKEGDFETRGQLVGTSVQGTTWLTADACRTSFVKVKQGTVAVRDLVLHRTVTVQAGQSYTVRKPR